MLTKGSGTSEAPGERLPARTIAEAPIIWNPKAGSKTGRTLTGPSRDDVQRLLERSGLGGPLIETGSKDEAEARIDAFRDAGATLVIAAGGDGTVGTLAGRLLGSGVVIGVLPLGSLMNLARSLGIPRDPERAAAVIADGRVRSVDAGRVDGQLFLEVVSVGLSAEILGEAQRVARGRLDALLQALRVVSRGRAADFELELDGRTEQVRALLVSVANAPYTGFGLTLAPDARMDDGLLDVVAFSGYGGADFARHLLGIVAGRRARSPRMRTFRARRVRVAGSRPLPCRADALDCGTTPLAVELLPNALRFIVPTHPEAGSAVG